MADNPTDPTKVTTDVVKESAETLKKFINEANDGITQLSSLLVGGVKTAFDTLSNVGRESFNNFKQVGNIINENNSLFDKFSKSYITFREITKTRDLFSGLTNSTATFGMVTDQITSMGTEWGNLTDFMAKSVPAGMGKAATVMLTNLKDNAMYGQKAEAQMISMLSSGGNLNQMFDDQGNLIGDLSSQTLKYVNSLGDVAEANGMTLSSTIKYADVFNRIPGVMQENINMGEGLGGEMSSLNAAMKVMTGSGQNIEEVMKAMSLAYQNLSNPMGAVENRAQKGLTLFATMSSLSKDLNLQFSETSDFLSDVARQFKFVGDNTEAAAKIMGRFTDALRNTGLTSSASIDIIKGMVKAVGELSIGTKALASVRAGGPGGLQGAVQIDKLNREGKSDQVMNMVLDSLRQQFGGRIVTQAEGAQSQEAAAQFTRQKMLLQSGAFGNLVGNGPGADDRATRLLEALASGNLGKAAKVGEEALKEVGQQGNNLQKETNTILSKVALSSERTAIATQLSALRSFRDYLGSGNDVIRKANEKNMMIAGERTSDSGRRDVTVGVDAKDWDLQFRDIAKRGAKELISGLDLSLSGASKFVGDVQKGLKEGGDAMQTFQSNMKEKNKETRIAESTPMLTQPKPVIANIQLNKLTAGANQQNQQMAIQAATRNNLNNTNNQSVSTKVTIDLAPGLDKIFEVKENTEVRREPAPVNPASKLNNNPGGNPYEPGY